MVYQYQKNTAGDYLCTHCDFTAKNQSTMHYHLKKHEGCLPHPCKHCDARFVQKGLLDMHIKSRHPETLEKKEMFKCPCNNCDYEDLRKGNRLIHFVRIHMKDLSDALKTKSEGNATACKYCNKTFKSMTQFYYHAASCIKPDSNHSMYSMYERIKN
jgi:hypothetical protein